MVLTTIAYIAPLKILSCVKTNVEIQSLLVDQFLVANLTNVFALVVLYVVNILHNPRRYKLLQLFLTFVLWWLHVKVVIADVFLRLLIVKLFNGILRVRVVVVGIVVLVAGAGILSVLE